MAISLSPTGTPTFTSYVPAAVPQRASVKPHDLPRLSIGGDTAPKTTQSLVHILHSASSSTAPSTLAWTLSPRIESSPASPRTEDHPLPPMNDFPSVLEHVSFDGLNEATLPPLHAVFPATITSPIPSFSVPSMAATSTSTARPSIDHPPPAPPSTDPAFSFTFTFRLPPHPSPYAHPHTPTPHLHRASSPSTSTSKKGNGQYAHGLHSRPRAPVIEPPADPFYTHRCLIRFPPLPRSGPRSGPDSGLDLDLGWGWGPRPMGLARRWVWGRAHGGRPYRHRHPYTHDDVVRRPRAHDEVERDANAGARKTGWRLRVPGGGGLQSGDGGVGSDEEAAGGRKWKNKGKEKAVEESRVGAAATLYADADPIHDASAFDGWYATRREVHPMEAGTSTPSSSLAQTPHETQVYHSFATQVAAAHSSNVPRSPHIAEMIHKLYASTSHAPAEAYRGRPLPPILTPRKRKGKGTRDDAAKEKNQAEAPTHTRTTSRPHHPRSHPSARPEPLPHLRSTSPPRNAHSSASAHLPHSHPRAPHGYSSAPVAPVGLRHPSSRTPAAAAAVHTPPTSVSTPHTPQPSFAWAHPHLDVWRERERAIAADGDVDGGEPVLTRARMRKRPRRDTSTPAY